MAAGNTDGRWPASVRLKTLVDRYIAPPLPTFADVRSVAELAEREENGGRPAPLPRFGEVLRVFCDQLGADSMSRYTLDWLLARLPDRISVDDANRFDTGELTKNEWLELAWRLPPEDRVQDCDWGFLSNVGCASLLALLGPGPPEIRRSLCNSINRDNGIDSPGSIADVLLDMSEHPEWQLVCIAFYGPAEARREFTLSYYERAPADVVADCVDVIAEAIDNMLGEGPPTRGRLSAREFVRRRKRAASANAMRYVRWRAAAVAACAALVRRGDAALRLGGYAFYEFGFDSD